ncbi:OLC1v1038426C1 [Oldenlandia corymbosa var. corymbosa]|uniref:OLC1v1038426C1 n=1 Tax=Oldenlandia corymbosa var. corymbosa TaxID=529605 RepID=A0AAV1D0F0_OLDCO|nr:OLC1v1038426C1 [Oldenlandia corymbosa var. corymbosa]
MAEINPLNKKEGDADEILDKEKIEEENGADLSEEIEQENAADTSSSSGGGLRTSPTLTELNLVVLLSFLSSAPGEFMDFQDDHNKTKSNLKDPNQPHHSVPRISQRQRVTNEFRASSPQSARFQTKIKDCRYVTSVSQLTLLVTTTQDSATSALKQLVS